MFNPKYIIDDEMLANLIEIEVSLATIEVTEIPDPWKDKMAEDANRRRVLFGLKQAGLNITSREVAEVLTRKIARDSFTQSDQLQLIGNYFRGLALIDRMLMSNRSGGWLKWFTRKFMSDLHCLLGERVLPSHVLGVFREVEINFGNVVGVPSIEVSYHMEDLFRWVSEIDVRSRVNKILLSGIVRAEILRVQPFTDGNIQLAQVLSWGCMRTMELKAMVMFCAEDVLEGKNIELRQALTTTASGDYGDYLKIYCEALREEAHALLMKVREMDRVRRRLELKQQRAGLTERQCVLLENIKQTGHVDIHTARTWFPHLSDDSLLRDLKNLTEKKFIKKKGKTKGVVYLYTGKLI